MQKLYVSSRDNACIRDGDGSENRFVLSRIEDETSLIRKMKTYK